jgi:hypothetical protein
VEEEKMTWREFKSYMENDLGVRDWHTVVLKDSESINPDFTSEIGGASSSRNDNDGNPIWEIF